MYIVQYFFGNMSLMYLSYGNFWTLVKNNAKLRTLVSFVVFLLQYLNFENIGKCMVVFFFFTTISEFSTIRCQKKINEEVDFKRIWSERQPIRLTYAFPLLIWQVIKSSWDYLHFTNFMHICAVVLKICFKSWGILKVWEKSLRKVQGVVMRERWGRLWYKQTSSYKINES